MNALKVAAIIHVAVLFASCASYRTVSVLVRDEKTHMPVIHVTVTTVYNPAPFSIASTRQHRAITDDNGVALLKANHFKREPTLFGRSAFPLVAGYRVNTPGYISFGYSYAPGYIERIADRSRSELP